METFHLNSISAISVDLVSDERITPQELQILTYKTEYWNNPGKFSLSKSVNLIEDCGVPRIGDVFDKYVHLYTKETLGIDYNFHRVSSWLTYNSNGTHHHLHRHPNSMISAVMYFNEDLSDQDLAPMKLHLPGLRSTFRDFNFNLEIETTNPHNLLTKSMDVKTHRIFVFPSYLKHETIPCGENENRYCIGVNYFIKDRIKTGTLEQIDIF